MRIFNSKEKSIDLSPTVKLLKHIGNVMFVLFCFVFNKKLLNDSLPPAYSSNLKYKLIDEPLADTVLPRVMPIQRWACNSVF